MRGIGRGQSIELLIAPEVPISPVSPLYLPYISPISPLLIAPEVQP